jgi:hypothetical protein
MKAERAFTSDHQLTVGTTLVLAREVCEVSWPDTCPVRGLWLSHQNTIGEPYLALEAALPEPWTSIPGYSDHKATTKGDILALFDRAIERTRV